MDSMTCIDRVGNVNGRRVHTRESGSTYGTTAVLTVTGFRSNIYGVTWQMDQDDQNIMVGLGWSLDDGVDSSPSYTDIECAL